MFGGFQHISPLVSSPSVYHPSFSHLSLDLTQCLPTQSSLSSSTAIPADPQAALASNCIRDFLGPVVQTVADALQSRGPSTLSELSSHIKQHCSKQWNEERARLVSNLNSLVNANRKSSKDIPSELYYNGSRVQMNKARGMEQSYITHTSHVRAALIVLLHHSLVKVTGGGGGGDKKQSPDPTSSHTRFTYTFLHGKARLFPRYCRLVEHIATVVDDNAATIIECLLVFGRLRAEDVLLANWKKEDGDSKLESLVHSFRVLIEQGYCEAVEPIASNEQMKMINSGTADKDDGIHGGEVEFSLDDGGNISGKKRSRSSTSAPQSKRRKLEDDDDTGLHPEVHDKLTKHRKIIPKGSVYRVNTDCFHASLRATLLSRLVTEMYPEDKRKSKSNDEDGAEHFTRHVGSVTLAALRYASFEQHSPHNLLEEKEESQEEKHHRIAEYGMFCPTDIIPYLSPETTKTLKAKVGGLSSNLSILLVQMSKLQYPTIVTEVEDALGHAKGGKFEICTRQLLHCFRDRIVHRMLTSHHSLAAARIVSILQMNGHCESDTIADDALMPAKEAREILHKLQKTG